MSVNANTPRWTKLILRAWANPAFKADFVADPAAILQTYGIASVNGVNIAQYAGRIDVTDATDPNDRPAVAGDRLTLPFPAPPADFDQSVTEGLEGIAAGYGDAPWDTHPAYNPPPATSPVHITTPWGEVIYSTEPSFANAPSFVAEPSADLPLAPDVTGTGAADGSADPTGAAADAAAGFDT